MNYELDPLDAKSIDEAIKLIEKMQNAISQSNLDKFVRTLGRQGIRVATENFATAWYDGTNDVTVDMSDVTVKNDGNTACISLTATGEAVLFIEFGTGVYYGDDAAVRASLIGNSGVVGRGEYGLGRGMHMTWGFDDANGNLVLTHGNPSNACMYDTRKYLERIIRSTAEEVFRW